MVKRAQSAVRRAQSAVRSDQQVNKGDKFKFQVYCLPKQTPPANSELI